MPVPRGTKISDAQRKASNKYDAAHYVTLAAKATRAEAEAFRAWCESNGKSVNAALIDYIRACISQDKADQDTTT